MTAGALRLAMPVLLGIATALIAIMWTYDGWADLCLGPHVPSTGRIPAVKLLSVAGALAFAVVSRTVWARAIGRYTSASS